ncbi:MAG TPA: NlpC/P60 family protein [Deltaproteobacteria bacterium]|nr:NlpC/P60 family protein [Deltaproteobacteria bacterium]
MAGHAGTRSLLLCATVAALALIVAGCALRKVEVAPLKTRGVPKPRAMITAQKMGYAIQVGAFRDVGNAARLTRKLESRGIDAFYFHHASGFFKVRFGDYPTLSTAAEEARRLKDAGIIDVYFVVNPGEYAVARGKSGAGPSLRADIVETAMEFVGLPYLWGGADLDAPLDCSGLVMAVYRLNGLDVPRTSQEQYEGGTPVDMEELEAGDLVFFSTSGNGRVSHVGIYIGDGRFIHAPRRGKTICADSLSSGYYRDRFQGARSYLR